MKIGIDYRLANSSYRGMARYCHEIVKELLNLDKNNEYVLIIDSEPKEKLAPKNNCRYIKVRTTNFIIGEQFSISSILFKEKFDVFWSPYNTFPIFKPCKTKLLVTVHDLIFFYPIEKGISSYQRIGALYRRYVLKYFYKKVDSFFTVSLFSKTELLRLLPIRKPIDVTYNCIDKFAEKVDFVRKNSILENGNYFFTLSGDGPNKNLNVLLNLFENDFSSEKLIVGGLGKDSKYRKRESTNIHFLPYGLSDEELIKTYLNCRCFLFFSKYEGFGIPIIEAAICGKPILASNTTSIPEILGDFGRMSSPLPTEIRKLIDNYIIDPIKAPINYTPLIKRFNSWSVPAGIILKRINEFACIKIPSNN